MYDRTAGNQIAGLCFKVHTAASLPISPKRVSVDFDQAPKSNRTPSWFILGTNIKNSLYFFYLF